MTQQPYQLDQERRELVLHALRDVCVVRDWVLLATHVRSNHVHVVVDALAEPGKIMNTLKAYASRRLNRAGVEDPDRRRWTRHGSTRYLWKREHIEAAIAYVAEGQGQPMALYVNPNR